MIHYIPTPARTIASLIGAVFITFAGFAALALSFTLTGCGGTTGAPSDGATGSNRPATTEPTKVDDTPVQFGKSFTYPDSLTITVSTPQPFKPSDTSSVTPGSKAKFVAFTVTIVNDTKGTYDPALFTMTAQSGNTEAESVFDSAQKLEGAPTTPVLSGREGKFRWAFAVTAVDDIVVQVQPGVEYEPVVFTSGG